MGLLKKSRQSLRLEKGLAMLKSLRGYHGQHQFQPALFTQIDYESLIPKSHLLRRIDCVLDLAFLPELTKPLYAESGGGPRLIRWCSFAWSTRYLYGIESDRQLCEEVGYNLAYRWFCRLSFKDKVPDHSSMTKIRDRLGLEDYGQIFREVVKQCEKVV